MSKTLYDLIKQMAEERRAAKRVPWFAKSNEVYQRAQAEGSFGSTEHYFAEIRRLAAGDIIKVHQSMHCDLYEPLV